jgi:hypothetical protein
VAQGSKANESKATKKLLDRKDKQIENMQKKLKFSATNHPQTEEIFVYKKNDDLKQEVLDLKSKFLQAVQENKELMKKGVVEIVLVISHLVGIEELTRSLSQVSLKDQEITTLKEEKKAPGKANKEYQDKNANLKDRLKGKSVPQSAHHSIWDLIAVEVTKFRGELKILESKKAYIYSALEKYIKTNEQLYLIHKYLVAKAHSVIKFFKFSSDEALRAFKIQDRFQMIHSVHRIIDKDIALEKVKPKIEELKKEIKNVYSIFKPLIEK